MITALSLLVLLPLSQPPATTAPPVRMGVHGMVLFGGGGGSDVPTYLSHIPMFHPPHDLQLVLQVSLRHPSWKAAPSFSDTGYTLVPERLDLTALSDGRLTSFTAAVFRGNFEAGGVEIHKGVQVTVQRVVLLRALSSATPPPAKDAAVRYFWLPGGFLLHEIAAPPDFDHVLRAGGGAKAKAPAGTVVTAVARLRERDPVQLDGSTRLIVEKELSYLVGPEFVVPAPPASDKR